MIKLRQVREHRKWSLLFVANSIGVTKATIHDLETGRRKGSIEVWDALEDLFGIPQRKLRESIRAATPDITKKPDGNPAKDKV